MTQVLSLTELSEEQSRKALDYFNRAGRPGDLTGLLLGEALRNSKPITIEGSRISLIRFSNPDFKDSELVISLFRKEFYKTAQFASKYGISGVGESNGQFWMKRSFFQRTLVDLTREEVENNLKLLVPNLILQVKEWLSDGVIHAHLCPENIGVEEGQPVVIDFNFGLLDDFQRESFAPEVRDKSFKDVIELIESNEQNRSAIDIFGLGFTLKSLGEICFNTPQIYCIARMLSETVEERPKIEEVEKIFGNFFNKSSGTSSDLFSLQSQPSVEDALSWLQGTTRLGPDLVSQIRGLIEEKNSQLKSRNDAVLETFSSIKKEENPIKEEKLLDAKKVYNEAKIPKSQRRVKKSNSSSLFYMAILGLILALGYYFFSSKSDGRPIAVNYKQFWQSAVPSKMAKVAEDAVDYSDENAELVILEDIFSGNKRQKVNSELIIKVFNPEWENEISLDDRKQLLSLALHKLMDRDPPKIKYNEVHPGALFGLLSSASLGELESRGQEISVLSLTKLPGIKGKVFSGIVKLGVKDFSEISTHAVVKILSGDYSLRSIQAFIGEIKDPVSSLSKLGLFIGHKDLPESFFAQSIELLKSGDESLDILFNWFTQNESIDWGKITSRVKLALASGGFDKTLSFEYILDLVTFPISSTKNTALNEVRKQFKNTDEPTLNFLASNLNKFTRSQTVFLLRALRVNEHSLIDNWFESSPAPQEVVKLLIVRSNLTSPDAYSIDAARYLINKPWEASPTELEILAQNPDSLVRSLVYSKLDASDPISKSLIKKMIKFEPDPRLRKELKFKLDIG